MELLKVAVALFMFLLYNVKLRMKETGWIK